MTNNEKLEALKIVLGLSEVKVEAEVKDEEVIVEEKVEAEEFVTKVEFDELKSILMEFIESMSTEEDEVVEVKKEEEEVKMEKEVKDENSETETKVETDLSEVKTETEIKEEVKASSNEGLKHNPEKKDINKINIKSEKNGSTLDRVNAMMFGNN